jgi:pimeloyl-ACP methyl ester carboxylesterase
VTGLWLPRPSLWLLAWRVRRCGYRVVLYSYPSVRNDLQQNAAALAAFVARLPPGPRHWVAFSLGGLVVRALFHFYPQPPPGRLVTLGTPHGGNLTATHLAASAWGRRLIGRSVLDLVAGRPQTWVWQGQEVGSIAGSVGLGLGRLVVRSTEPHDGTVRVSETRAHPATDGVSVKTSHVGLLFSATAARAVCRFLATGRFAA